MSDPHVSQGSTANGEAGFTFLELTIVVVIIGTLFLFSYQKYLDLLVDVEKANVEQTVGVLRSALGMKVAKLVVDGRIADLKKYEESNPINLLAEVPISYKGEVADMQAVTVGAGSWYFVINEGLLVYKVKNVVEFFSEKEGLDQIRHRVSTVFDEDKKTIVGLSLRPIEKYSWFKKI